MGLGLLFIGYVLTSLFTLTPAYFITDLVGAFLMYEALMKLRRHAERFKYAIWSVYVLFFHAAVQCVYRLLEYIGIFEQNVIFTEALEIFRLVIVFVYTVALLSALRELSLSVGDEKLADKCKRNIWLLVISYIFIISLSLDIDALVDYVAAFSAFALLFKLICAVLICVNIYSCYMWICLEGDLEEKPSEPKKSKLAEFFKKVRSGGSDEETDLEFKALKESEKKNRKK